jgi:hypothetical protein
MVEGTIDSKARYRTSEWVRLVSNAAPNPRPANSQYDDDYDTGREHQTALVKLGDEVRATLLLDGKDQQSIKLPVGRPPTDDGPKAIRTADINFVTLQGVKSDPAQTVARISEDWAQLAVRFNLVSAPPPIVPVSNVLSLSGTAQVDGKLSVDFKPLPGGNVISVNINVLKGQTDEVIAKNLAEAISKAGIPASHHHNKFTIGKDNFDQWLVLVNKGGQVMFDITSPDISGIAISEPVLNFTDDITPTEGNVLGLNFTDKSDPSIYIIAVGNIRIVTSKDFDDTLAGSGGFYLLNDLPGWVNLAIITEIAVDSDDAGAPTTAGHEMCHILFNGGNSAHTPNNPTNLAFGRDMPVETFDSPKRLTNDQNTLIRSPRNVGGALLNKK